MYCKRGPKLLLKAANKRRYHNPRLHQALAVVRYKSFGNIFIVGTSCVRDSIRVEKGNRIKKKGFFRPHDAPNVLVKHHKDRFYRVEKFIY